MNIEANIFKRTTINIKKLEEYGFKKTNDIYYYSTNIFDNKFKVEIEINILGEVKGKVIDLAFNEEYNNFRIEDITGEFVNKVKEEYEKVLIDIKNKCFISKNFIYDQTNRITELIKKEYNDDPEFPWTDSHHGTFKNPISKKWYAIIMCIPKKRIDKGDEEVEIMNIKLDENEILELLKRDGFYKAYHMNKKKWISIILDNTLKDEEIMNLIKESHKLTEK